MSSMEAQIIRLVEEIADDEKGIRQAKELLAYAITDRSKQQALDEIAMYEASLERKLLLLKILKG